METSLIRAFERALQCWLEGEYALHGDQMEQGWDGRTHMDLCWGLQDASRLYTSNSNSILSFHPFHEHPHLPLAGDTSLDEVHFRPPSVPYQHTPRKGEAGQPPSAPGRDAGSGTLPASLPSPGKPPPA